jgi:hypothetical protein
MSTVILDTITGKSTATTITIGSTPVVSASANSLTIRGEGSAQTSIQQGLAKAWNHYDQKGDSGSTQSLDSFNISSTTDNSTGISTHNFANDMNNNFSSTAGSSIDRATANLFTSGPETSLASASVKLSCLKSNNDLGDPDSLMMITCGDLA